MLTLTYCVQLPNLLYTARITGPVGEIEMQELTWIMDRPDLLDIYYWSAWATIQGAYHCCWSIPGKVTLLPK